MLIFLGNNENKAIVLSHCTGMGPGPVQGQMESTVRCRNVHTGGERQRKGPGPIVSYCALPIPGTSPGTVPVQCDYTIITIEKHSNEGIGSSRLL